MGVQHKLTRDNVLWVFVSCSDEARHLEDIVFAVDALRRRGISDDHWMIFSDHPRHAQHLGPYGMDGQAYPETEFAARLSAAAPHEYAIVVVGGHGHVTGLGAPPVPPAAPVLPPFALCAAVRSIPGLVRAVIVLSQCFGGVFNFSDAQTEPKLVIFGATNLNPSLSLPTTLREPLKQTNQAQGLTQWAANAFSLDFFLWMRSPTDIDGDGALTVMDAFKFAGANSNARLRKTKLAGFVHAQLRVRRLEEAEAELVDAANGQDPMRLINAHLAVNAVRTELQQAVEILYTTHEPWLLGAYLAVDMVFEP